MRGRSRPENLRVLECRDPKPPDGVVAPEALPNLRLNCYIEIYKFDGEGYGLVEAPESGLISHDIRLSLAWLGPKACGFWS